MFLKTLISAANMNMLFQLSSAFCISYETQFLMKKSAIKKFQYI